MPQAISWPGYRLWRLRRGAWRLPVYLLLGMGTWAGFLYIGRRANNRAWKRASAIYGAALVGAIAIVDTSSTVQTWRDDLSVYITVGVWIVGMVHSSRANKQWLEWSARRDAVVLPPSTPPWESPESLGGQATFDPTVGRMADLAQSGEETMSVEINSCSMDDLVARLGIPTHAAIRILESRARLGGFSSAEQLMTEGGLEPHVFADIHDRISLNRLGGPLNRPGRRLDL